MYPHLNEPNKYTVSFRSKSDEFSARLGAESLGGGGHDRASAVRITSDDSEKGLEKVLEAIAPIRKKS
jgi:nanoRNase/pAp phosphatase (c-di-AMP/oligoRNAs hydrolase)